MHRNASCMREAIWKVVGHSSALLSLYIVYTIYMLAGRYPSSRITSSLFHVDSVSLVVSHPVHIFSRQRMLYIHQVFSYFLAVAYCINLALESRILNNVNGSVFVSVSSRTNRRDRRQPNECGPFSGSRPLLPDRIQSWTTLSSQALLDQTEEFSMAQIRHSSGRWALARWNQVTKIVCFYVRLFLG